MNASDALHEQVKLFKGWVAGYPIESRVGEWECDYPYWEPLWSAAIALIDTVPFGDWSNESCADFLYALARDNEAERIADHLQGHTETLLALGKLSVHHPDSDAKWQLAAKLGNLRENTEAEFVLLKLVVDENEYVSRRALLSLGQLKSLRAEEFAERAWLTGHEYQRIASLWVLKNIGSYKLGEYVRRAEEDGRELVVQKAKQVQGAT